MFEDDGFDLGLGDGVGGDSDGFDGGRKGTSVHESKATGDKFTAADLTHLPCLYYLMATPIKSLFNDRPYVSAWCAAILARPAWSMVVFMVDKNKP
ncbi:hypothetical protein Q3G72_018896 [Acer saccharum]|nr:hypothetical protein Q3G72_018896 [Acer saccharum]